MMLTELLTKCKQASPMRYRQIPAPYLDGTNDARSKSEGYKRLALGRYPAVGLADARHRAERARVQISDGKDPQDDPLWVSALASTTAAAAPGRRLGTRTRSAIAQLSVLIGFLL